MGFVRIIAFLSRWLSTKDQQAGADAEAVFVRQARAHGFMVEGISQEPGDDYEQYRVHAACSVKRGDFLIRNHNVEVEVKCKTLYGRDRMVYFDYGELKAHEEMQRLTGDAVVFAVYLRRGDCADTESLRMIAVADVLARHYGTTYHDESKCFHVPFFQMPCQFARLSQPFSRGAI